MSPGLVHDAFIYGSDTEFVDTLTPFALEGLDRGETVSAVSRAENLELLRDALGHRADDVSFIDAADWYRHPARTLAAYHALIQGALASGAPGLRVIGEVEFGETDIGRAEWIRYEAMLNVAFQTQPASIICPYDTRHLPDHVIDDARRTHRHAIDEGRRQPSDRFEDPAVFAAVIAITLPNRLVDAIEVDGDLRPVRQFVRRTAEIVGLSAEHAADVCLVINELATNGLQHGDPPVGVRAWADEFRMVYEVTDHGPGPCHPHLGFVPATPDQPWGRGLWLSRQLVDRVEATPTATGNSVRVELALGSTP